ncbi:hypothetical protein C464_16282 [Halorubrum coriense DSM 10284]|uniref:Uncharacterized protein n=1 Tax=Halorubrum coriense DSM 10284 TaxID=1227466 RepID=M0EBC4_9EURY|nr:hypothetical protein C464_16282 [Halorubrum coriense DSM 10284]
MLVRFAFRNDIDFQTEQVLASRSTISPPSKRSLELVLKPSAVSITTAADVWVDIGETDMLPLVNYGAL